MSNGLSRRDFMGASMALAGGVLLGQQQGCASKSSKPQAAASASAVATTEPAVEPIIDIHQHTTYWGRNDAALLHHQKVMGVTKTILLPAGTPVNTPSTHLGKTNGLYAGAGPVPTCLPIVAANPGSYFYCSNEVPDLPDSLATIEKYLKQGAVGIGEQKFNVPCDAEEMQAIYRLAEQYNAPVLLHFQYEMFNTGFERFEAMLKKYPKVNFVGHAMLMWANIDAKCDQKTGYPKGKVTPGGLTDKWLTDYPNFFGDMSAGSGLNAMTRDEEHAVAFMDRHQDQLLYGSDCPDPAGHGPTCTGSQQIAVIRRLAPSPAVRRKLLHDNAAKLYKI